MESLVLLNGTSEDFVRKSHVEKGEYPYAEGCSGKVYKIGDFILKEFKSPENEHEVLEDLQGLDFVPTLFAYLPKKWIMTEFIKGMHIQQYLTHYPDRLFELIYILEKHVKEINKRGWIAKDLSAENIIVTDSGYPVIVDVGRFERGTGQDIETELISLKEVG